MINRKLKNGQKNICDRNYKMNTSYITSSNVYSIIKLENLVLMISNNVLAPNGGAHESKTHLKTLKFDRISKY